MTSHWFKLLTVVAALAAAVFLSAAAVFAQAGDLGSTVNGGLETGRTVVGFGAEPLQVIIMRIVQIALGFLGILAIVLILYGGVVWMTAGGDAGKIETAKAILRNATIGLLIIFAAFAIASFVLRALVGAFGPGDGTGGPCPVVGEVDATCDTGVALCSGSRICNTNFRWSRCVPNPLDADCPVPPPPRQCLVNSIKPADGTTLKIKNVVVRATLNLRVTNAADVVAHPEWFGIVRQGAAVADGQPCTGNDQCLSDRCDQVTPAPAPKTCVGNTVAGTVKVSGYVASFTPARICEPPFDAGAKLRHCFTENTAYEVHLQPTDIQCGNKPLVCAGGSCASTFTTGTLVDIAAPTAALWPSQICQAPANQLSARYTDDVGVSVVAFRDLTHDEDIGVDDLSTLPDAGEFKADGVTAEDDTDGLAHNLIPGPPAWDTSDAAKFAVGSRVEVEAAAEDQDENSARDTRTFSIRAGHCCNAVQDADELDVDCGGADCNRCGDGVPVIDYISPADDAAANNNPAVPATYDEDVPFGAPDNFITLTGRNFGDDPGRVIFLGTPAVGDEVDAALPTAVNAACPADTWRDDEIIVAVPDGAVDGPLQVVTAATATRPAMSDATNDGDGTRERRIQDFDVDPARVLAGLCGIDPASGKYRDPDVRLEGVRLGDAIASDVFFGAVQALEPPAVWRPDQKGVDTIEVPNVRPGTVGVTVRTGAASSNAVRFTVTAGDATDPVIYRFTPTSGGEGTYVTISGANFGDVPGKVFFLSGADPDIEANDEFPLECRDDLWRSDRVIVKVPNNAADGLIQVRRADGRTADSSSVIEAAGQPDRKEFDVNGVVTPGLCKIQPRLGPVGVPVTLSGERLENFDVITFFNAKTAAETARAFSPALDTVSTAVPVGAQTGDVTVADTGPDPDAVSNGLRFTVGTCTGAGSCGGTEECCSAGPLTGACMPKGECGGQASAGAYRYYFTTGRPGAGVVTACTRSVNNCAARGIASPTPYTVSGEAGAITLAGRRDDEAVPVNAVVSLWFTDEVSVTSLVGTVKLYQCNAAAAFDAASCTVDVPGNLVVGGGKDPLGLRFFVFTPTVALNPNMWYRPSVAATVTTLAGDPGISGNSAGSAQYVWQFKTNADLGTVGCIDCMPAKSELTQQYTATEVDGVNARKLKGVAFAGGQACVMLRTTAPWTWTVDPADTAQLNVPASATDSATARAIGETPGDNPATPIFDPDLAKVVAHLTAPPRDTSCLIGVTFNPPVVTDQWPNCGSACANAEIGAAFSASLNAEADTAAAAYASSIVNPGNVKLFSCGADYGCAVDSQADVPITPPVYLEGSAGATCGDGTRDNNDDGTLDPFEEECDDGNAVSGDGCSGACLLEGSSARYGSTCGNGRTETGEACDDGNTVDTDACSRVCLPTGARPSGSRPVGSAVPEVRFYPTPAHYYGSLVPGTYYRVVLNGAIASTEGKPLGRLNYATSGVATDPPNAYSWVFKTSDDPRLCAISRVAVAPANVTLRPDARQRYAAAPASQPDACSSRGQRLNPYGYQWAWDSSSRVTADFPNRAAGFADACGNSVLELGEDCDVGAVAGTVVCSAAADANACLRPGNAAATCGNGTREAAAGEECDDGNTKNGDGCSGSNPDVDGAVWLADAGVFAPCQLEGNANYGVRVCGNGVVENDPDAGDSTDADSRLDADEEECDDGNTRDGDGCSRRCLWEGSIAGVSVCGDGILGRGESCETCGPTGSERAIYAGSCGDSDFAKNRVPSKDDDDCTASCVIDGNPRGVDRRAPYPVCGNGVVDAGEECDTGTEPAGTDADGCTARCTHAGSVYDTAAFNPPTVGPYQVAQVAPAASFPGVPDQTDISAGTLGQASSGKLKVAYGQGAFRITAFQPTDAVPACLTQYAVVTFSQKPNLDDVRTKMSLRATNPADGTVVAAPALTFEYDAVNDPQRVRIRPDGGAWPVTTKLEFTFPATIANADASSTLDCTSAACTFAFTTGTAACSISRLDVQPTRAFVKFAATQQYKVTAYGASHGPVVQATTLPPANRQPRIANFYDCPGNPATARTFTAKFKDGGFNVTVIEGGVNVTGSLEAYGVPKDAAPFDADARVVPLGCFLALDYRQTRDNPQPDDTVSFTATLGYTEEPTLPGGQKYAWSAQESSDDTAGNNAVKELTAVDGCVARNTEHRCADVEAVGRWVAAPPPADPSYESGEGYRTARVVAKDPTSPVSGSAWFGVGNLCTKRFGSGTLADIYPLRPPATASSTAVAHFDGSGDLVTGDGRVIRPSVSSGVDYTKAGLTDGSGAVLGNAATFSPAAKSALDLPNTGGLFSPEEGTISLWFKLDLTQSSPLFTIRPSGVLWARYEARDGKVHLIYAEGGGRFHRQSRVLPAPLDAANPWHYLVARWREREVAGEQRVEVVLTLDGDLAAATESAGTVGNPRIGDPAAVYVGYDPAADDYLAGALDEFEIRRDYLDDAQIVARWEAYVGQCLGATPTAAGPTVVGHTPVGDPQCRNAQVSVRFSTGMDAATVLAKESGGQYANVRLVCLPDPATGTDACSATERTLRTAPGNIIRQLAYDDITDTAVVKAPTELTPGAFYQVTVRGGDTGVRSEQGLGLASDYEAEFTVGDALCNCTGVVVSVSPPTPAAVRRTDAFTCAGGAASVKACPDDQDAAGGNQHAYTAQCVDATVSPPQAVDATYAWTVTNSKIVSAAPPDQQSTFVTNTAVNGDAQVRVEAKGVAPATGEQTGAVQVVNFVCSNPWPPLYSFPFNDLEMNFDLSYCRDPAHTPSTADDLPALQLPPAVIGRRGNVLKEFFFANTFGTPQTLLQSKLGSEVKGVRVNTESVVTPPESAGCERSVGGAAFNYSFDFPDVGHYQLQAEVVNIDRRFSDPNTIKVQLNAVDVGSPQRLSSLDERQTAIFDLGQVAKGTRDISLLFTDDDGPGVNQSLTVCKVGIAKAAISHDVIGLKVLANPLRLSPATWYSSGICAGRPATVANLCTRDADCGAGVVCAFNVPNRGNPSELAVDGYTAVRDGRSVYVAGTNLSGANLYTNIYLLSYNEGAAEPTTAIFSQLLQRLKLNTNLTNNRTCSVTTNNVCTSDLDCPRDAAGFPAESCDAVKDKVRRDSRRIGELRDLELATSAAARASGAFPLWDAVRRQFTGGTYLPGITFSPWPSWAQTLGASLRLGRLPKDPLNAFLGCQPPYDAVTCWDERALQFQCRAPAYVYGYKVSEQGAVRQLFTTFESDPVKNSPAPNQWIGGAVAGFACPNFVATALGDRDGDGVADATDNCPDAANAAQADDDRDQVGNVCDPCRTSAENDADHDGFCQRGADNPGGNGDNCPKAFNPDQRDSDGNGQGDACDNTCSRDADRDGVCDEQDNCPTVANPPVGGVQPNADAAQDTASGQVWPNGLTWGDACDLCTDVDGDGYGAGLPAETCKKDNCSAEANPSQDDYDNDGVGYACDACIDTDNDRLTDQLIANSGFEEGTKGFKLFVQPGADAALTAAASYRRLETRNDSDPNNDDDHGDVWRGIRSARLDLTSLLPGSYVGLRTEANPARLATSRDFGVRYFAQAQVKPSDPALVSRLRLHLIRTCTQYPAKAGPHGLAFRGTCGDPKDDPGYDDDTTPTDPDVPGEPGLGFRVPLTLPNAVQDLKNGWYTIRAEFAAPTNLAADEVAFELIVEGGVADETLWVDDFTAGLVCAHCAESCLRPASELPPIGWGEDDQLYRPVDNCNTFNNFNDAVRNCSGTGGKDRGYSICTAADLDEDNVGDACDGCTDRDGDGFGDGPVEQRRACPGSFSRVDNCPVTVNPDQRDYDNDSATCSFATAMPYRQSGTAGNCGDPKKFDLSCRFCGGNACDLDADGDRCFNWSQLRPIPGNGNFPTESDVVPRLVARRERPAANWLQFSGDQDVDGLATDCDLQTCGNSALEDATVVRVFAAGQFTSWTDCRTGAARTSATPVTTEHCFALAADDATFTAASCAASGPVVVYAQAPALGADPFVVARSANAFAAGQVQLTPEAAAAGWLITARSPACGGAAEQVTLVAPMPLRLPLADLGATDECLVPQLGIQQCEQCDLKDFTLGELPAQQQQFMVDNFCAICANLQCSIDTMRTCLQLTGKEGVLGRDVTFTRNPDILRRPENRTEFLWVGNGTMSVRKMVGLDYLQGLTLGDTFGNGFLDAKPNQQMYNFSVYLGTALDKFGQCPNRVWIPNRDRPGGGAGDQGIAYEFSACPNDNPLVSNAHLMRGCKAGVSDDGVRLSAVDTRGNSWATVEDTSGIIVMTLASTNDPNFDAADKGKLHTDPGDAGCLNESSSLYQLDLNGTLANDTVYALEVDSLNNLWLTNRQGITLKVDLDWIYGFPSPFGGKIQRRVSLSVNATSKVCTLTDDESRTTTNERCWAFSTPYGHEIAIDANDGAWVGAYRESASIADLHHEIYGIDAKAAKWGDAKTYTPGVTQARYLAVDINNYLWVANGENVEDVVGVPTIVETNGVIQVYTSGANIGKRTDVDVFFNGPGDATGKNRNYGIAADSEGFLWMMYQGDGQPGKVLRIDTTKPDSGDGGLGGMRDGSRGRLITDVFDIPGGFRDDNSPWTRSSLQTGLNPRILKAASGGEVIVDGGDISFESADTPVSGWQKRWGKVLYDVTLNGGEITRADVYLTDNEADFASLASTAWIPVDEFNRLIGKTPVQSAADYNTGGRRELEIAGRYLRLRFQAKPDPADSRRFPVIRNLRITCKDPAGNDICP